MARLCLLLVGALSLLLLSGCGGSSGGSTATSARTGKLTLTVKWPAKTKLIPVDSQSINAVLTGTGGTVLGQQLLARPASGNTTTASFTNIAAGSVTLTATAYPNADGSGTAQAAGSAPATITAGQTATVTVTMNDTIASVVVTPPNPVLTVGAQQQMIMTAYDGPNGTGDVVLTSPSTTQWSSQNTTYATVSGTGLATGVVVTPTPTPATCTITATETESGVSGSTSFTVVAAQQTQTGPFKVVVDNLGLFAYALDLNANQIEEYSTSTDFAAKSSKVKRTSSNPGTLVPLSPATVSMAPYFFATVRSGVWVNQGGGEPYIFVLAYQPGEPFTYYVLTFSEAGNGQLTLTSTTPLTGVAGTNPTAENLFGDEDGSFLYVSIAGVPPGGNTVTSEVVRSFQINNDGSLTQNGNDLALPSFPNGYFGFTCATTTPGANFAYVGLRSYGVGEFSIDEDGGTLTYMGYLAGDYPANDIAATAFDLVANTRQANTRQAKTRGGSGFLGFVYWSGSFSNGLDYAGFNESGVLTSLGTTATQYGTDPVSLATSFFSVFAIDQAQAKQVDSYQIQENGSLSPNSPSGAIPAETGESGLNYYLGIAVNGNQYVYTPNEADSSISQFSIDDDTNGLSPLVPATVGG
jgi:hypothetical protein